MPHHQPSRFTRVPSPVPSLISGLLMVAVLASASGCDGELQDAELAQTDCEGLQTPAAPTNIGVEHEPAKPDLQGPDTSASYGNGDEVEPRYRDLIRRIVRAHINEVRHCYNEGLSRDPSLAGKVVVNFTIGSDGKVAKSAVASSTLSENTVDSCISEAVSRWKFPKTRNGQSLTVNYPFVLETGDDTPAPKALPKAEFSGDEQALGGMQKDLIRRIVRAHINEVRHCYNQGLKTNPELSGRVVVGFKIAGTGEVETSEVHESTLGNSGVDTCIAGAIETWKFPKTRGGGSIVVNYPFILEPD